MSLAMGAAIAFRYTRTGKANWETNASKPRRHLAYRRPADNRP